MKSNKFKNRSSILDFDDTETSETIETSIGNAGVVENNNNIEKVDFVEKVALSNNTNNNNLEEKPILEDKLNNIDKVSNENKLPKFSLFNNITNENNLSKFNKDNLLSKDTLANKKIVVTFELQADVLEALDDVSYTCNGYPKNLIVNEALVDLVNNFILKCSASGKPILKKPDSLKRGKKIEN
jgi:hypothetical protein